MFLFKLIIFGIAIYLISKVFKSVLTTPSHNRTMEGNQQKTDSLDLSDADIEDADFEEIDSD